MSFGVEYIGHVAVAAPGTGFVNRDTSHLCPGVVGMGRFDIMGRHAPEPGVVFLQSVGDRRHRHLPAQEHDKGFKKQRKAAAFPGPRHRHALDAMLRAIAARHARFQQALILEEVQVLPPLGAGVMRQAKLAALRAAKALPSLKIQLQKQLAWFAFKSTFLTFHPASSCRAAVNNTSGVIGPILFPLAKDLQGPAMRPLFLVNRVLRAPDSKKIMLDHPFTTGEVVRVSAVLCNRHITFFGNELPLHFMTQENKRSFHYNSITSNRDSSCNESSGIRPPGRLSFPPPE